MATNGNVSIEAKPAKVKISVLLPFCTESVRDVFMDILRSAVWRAKMDDRYIDAVKSGMTAKIMCIKSNDLSADWKTLTSKSQQLRQHQLLGYWAVKNYPALGKRLFGDTWEPVQRQSVEIIGREAKSSDAVDAVIMRKMKPRSIELTVSPTTVTKLRLFVKTPKNVGTYNENRISSAMTSFDIEDDHIDKCWKQLKCLNSSLSEPQSDSDEPDQINTAEATAIKTSSTDLSKSNIRPVKRMHTSRANEITAHNGRRLIPLVKRIHLDFANTVDLEADIDTDSDAAIDTDSDAGTVVQRPNAGSEAIQAIEQQNQQNIPKEASAGSIQIQTLLLEMERLVAAAGEKTSDEVVRKENEMLKRHLDANNALIKSLQLGVESSRRLYQMLEGSFQKQAEYSAKTLTESDKTIVDLSKKNSDLKSELHELKDFVKNFQTCSDEQIEDLKKRLVVAERISVEATETNAQQEKKIHNLTQYVNSVETPLQQKINVLTNNLSEAERSSVEMSKQKNQLEHEISELKQHVARAEVPLQRKIQELSDSLSKAEKFAVEMSENNAKLTQKLGEVNRHVINIQSLYEGQMHALNKKEEEADVMTQKIKIMEEQIIDLQSSVAAKDVEIIEAKRSEENLNILKEYTSSIAQDLQNQISEVEIKLADTQKTTTELTLENQMLKFELQRREVDSPPMVHGEELAVADQVEEGVDEIAVTEQEVSVATSDSVLVEPVLDSNTVVPNESQWTDPAPEFNSDDPIVRQCRPSLAKLPFGWLKFSKFKNAKYYPAFIYPIDGDGKRRAQWVTPDGYVSDTKKEFYDYQRSLPNELKKPSEVKTLKKFNQKFCFDLS